MIVLWMWWRDGDEAFIKIFEAENKHWNWKIKHTENRKVYVSVMKEERKKWIEEKEKLIA